MQITFMDFKDIYADEVLEARRDRSKRARFWAKIVSLVLVLTVASTLRSEPQLRLALMSAGVDGISALRGSSDSGGPSFMKTWMANAQSQAQRQNRIAEAQPEEVAPLRSKHTVKVNRHSFAKANPLSGIGPAAKGTAQGRSSRGETIDDTAAMADQLGQAMGSMKVGN